MMAQPTNLTQRSIIVLVVVVIMSVWRGKNERVSQKSFHSAVTETTKESNPEDLDELHEFNDVRNNLTIIGKKLPVIELLERHNSTTATTLHNISSITEGGTAEEIDNTTLMANEGTTPDTLSNAMGVPITHEADSETLSMPSFSTFSTRL
jgi:hypothetical protein